MAKLVIDDTSLIAIADAIRTKTGSSESLTITQMIELILNLPTNPTADTTSMLGQATLGSMVLGG